MFERLTTSGYDGSDWFEVFFAFVTNILEVFGAIVVYTKISRSSM